MTSTQWLKFLFRPSSAYRSILRERLIPRPSSLSFVKWSSSSAPHFEYEWFADVETLERYRSGGYHPIQIGDRLHGRYRVVDKLGHGSFSTIWLARDERLSRYVAVKVGTADSGEKEIQALSQLASVRTWDGVRGAGLIRPVLDSFRIDGPNGTHSCLVTAPARCSVSAALYESSTDMFQLDVARALAAQLVIAVARIHEQGFVHGDLHLGNMLIPFQSQADLDHLSEEDFHAKYGALNPKAVTRIDGQPLPPGVPPYAYQPVFLGDASECIELRDAKLQLADFGVACRPTKETRFENYPSIVLWPPEFRFEPATRPLSFASDIWALGCSIWEIVGQGSLWCNLFPSEDKVTCEQVDALGPLPEEWWEKWEGRSRYFTEMGQPVGDREPRSLEQQFEYSVQKPRREQGWDALDKEEEDAFLALMRRMLVFRPSDRPSAQQLLGMEWMKEWALPECHKIWDGNERG